MAEPIAYKISRAIATVNGLYHRLVLLVGPVGSGKTAAIRELSSMVSVPVTNVNLELSQSLLEMSPRQRTLQTPKILNEITTKAGSLVLFDNTEVLFDVQIQQDPLRLLQGLSRNRTVVATWNGIIKNHKLMYAEPGHPEFRSYEVDDIVFICTVDENDITQIVKNPSEVVIR